MSTVFILGPSLEAVTEPLSPAAQAALQAPGRRTVIFDSPASAPGGTVHLQLLPGATGDVAPVNVYAFYVNPPSSVPTGDANTPDWYFASTAPRGSAVTSHGPSFFSITVPGVLPGVYHVQIVVEYPA